MNYWDEQGGRGGHIQHHRVGLARVQAVADTDIVLGPGQVGAHVMQHLRKALELLRGLGPLLAFNLVKAFLDEGSETCVVQVVAGNANDAPTLGQATVPKRLKQGWDQFAPGQVAGAAEEDEVEAHDVFGLH